jgi:hypothetical protein
MNKPTCIIYAPIETYSGYGARSRDIAKSILQLKKDEWDVKIFSCPWGNTPHGFLENNNEWFFLKEYILNPSHNAQPDIMIWITIPSEFQKVGKFNIGINAGIETTIPNAKWIEGLNRMDLNLVSSEHSKKVFLDAIYQRVNQQTKQSEGIIKVEKPLEVLFEGVNTDIYRYLDNPSLEIADLNTIPDKFCLLFVSHWIGSIWEDRKNIGLLIKSFLETFKNKPNKPTLILKTCLSGASYIDRDEVLKRIEIIKKSVNSKDLPNIYLLHGEFTDIEMNEIYNHPKIKAMVNLTKGEGFGRTLMEFTQSKKPLITSNWSGQLDFLKPKFTTLINGNLVDVHPTSINEWILKDAKWFAPDLGEVGFYLKDIFENYKKYIDGGKRQSYHCRTNFSFDKMTEELGEYLKQVPEFPKQIPLVLPQLKKISLPKLSKIE